jgi:hypothetical protein
LLILHPCELSVFIGTHHAIGVSDRVAVEQSGLEHGGEDAQDHVFEAADGDLTVVDGGEQGAVKVSQDSTKEI